MKLTPSSTTRRSTLSARPRSLGSPQMSSLSITRIAPKPRRFTTRSPTVIVLTAFLFRLPHELVINGVHPAGFRRLRLTPAQIHRVCERIFTARVRECPALRDHQGPRQRTLQIFFQQVRTGATLAGKPG